MIEFSPSDEQRMLIDSVHRFAANVMRPAAHEADEQCQIPPDIIEKGWDLGILPGMLPNEFGGYSDDSAIVTGVLALEELGWGDISMAMSILAPGLFAIPVLLGGTDSQKRDILPAFCDAPRPQMTGAVMEPNLLFDVFRPTLNATFNRDSATLDGEKTYVPCAEDSKAIIVHGQSAASGYTCGFIVQKDSPGFEIGPRNQLMGLRALPSYPIKLHGVKISKDQIIGREDQTTYKSIVNRSRIGLGALAVGVARAAYEYARDYARERIQFGVPIATKQAIAFKLAEMAIEVDAARLMVWEAAWLAQRGQDVTQTAAILKSHASRMSLSVTDSAVQILGGHGYIRDHPVERWLRDARGVSAFEGMIIV